MFVTLDESGIHPGSSWMAFGVLWLPDNALVPGFEAAVTKIRQDHGFWAEVKWSAVDREYIDAYLAFAEALFGLPGLRLDVRVVKAAEIDKAKIREYNGSAGRSLAYLKFMRRTIQHRIGPRGVAIGQKDYVLLYDNVSGKDDIKQDFRNYLRSDLAAAARAQSAEGCQFRTITNASSKVVSLLQAVDLLTGATCAAWTGDRANNHAKQSAREVLTRRIEAWRGAPLTTENEMGPIDVWRHRWPPPAASGAGRAAKPPATALPARPRGASS